MGGLDKSSQRSSSFNNATSQSFIAPQQQAFLSNLLRGTGSLLNEQAGQIGGAAGQLSANLFNQGEGFLGQLTGQQAQGVGGQIGQLDQFGQSQDFQQLLAQLQAGGGAGTSTLQGIAAGGQNVGPLAGTGQLEALGSDTTLTDALLQQNPALQGQISQLDLAIQDQLRSTAGTISGQATLQGATGGSRQALATGLAGQEATRQFGQGAQALISQDFATRQALAPQLLAQQQQGQLAAAGLLQQGDLAQQQLGLQGQQQQLGAAGLLQQGGQFNQAAISDLLATQLSATGAAGQLGIQQGQLQGQASQVGLGSLNNLFNLGLSPFSAQFSPFLAAAQIFGAPTVLSQSQASGSSASRAGAFGFNILSLG